MILFVLCCLFFAVGLGGLVFTGDANRDFTNSEVETYEDAISGELVSRARNFGVVQSPDAFPGTETDCDGGPCPDVGIPQALCASPGDCPVSGWDVRNLFFQYDARTDTLNVGVDCFGICGDADGDGDPGSASSALVGLGGQDFADLARAEGVALALDFDLDVGSVLPTMAENVNAPFDFIVGVPAGQPAGATPNPGPGDVGALECTLGQSVESPTLLSMAACFGLYEYQPTTEVGLAARFLRRVQLPDGAAWPVVNHNPSPSQAQPDLEWSIERVTELRALKGLSFQRDSREPWTLLVQGFAGSFSDDGIGEDFLPSQNAFITVDFPCLEFDVCDVCLGDGQSCLDCEGMANGPAQYDECDVCMGDGKSCADCRGTPNGPAEYDLCGVCEGVNECGDCAGVVNGGAEYDECDVCMGNGQSCVDCRGAPNGPAEYDECDMCGGDSTTCVDCSGVPNGPTEYDACDVCGGDASTCSDCLGQPNGAAEYDVCDVCAGDGTGCLDCRGVPNGPAVRDVCGVCEGLGDSCDDCAGTPLGTCEYDACDECCGDSSSCLDCSGDPWGTKTYDGCGVCDGDGSSCVCMSIHCTATPEVDHALLEWTVVNALDRIEHTVDLLEGIKSELCQYNVGRGALAEDIADYLSTANDFRDILENFCYVQDFFVSSIKEAVETLPAAAP